MIIGKSRTNQPVEGELEDKDLKVKTIEQSEPNWYQDLDFSTMSNLPANCEVTNVYCKIIQWNRELHIVFNIKIKNNGASASNAFNSVNNYILLPEDIAARIIDFDGKSVVEQNAAPIAAGSFHEGSQSYPTSLEAYIRSFTLRNTDTANQFTLDIHDIVQINAGETLYITGRISLDLA